MTKTLADLKPGETGIIIDFLEPELTHKLLEMGCVPGEVVTFRYPAPLGDPICIQVHGYDLAIRRNEAKSVVIK